MAIRPYNWIFEGPAVLSDEVYIYSMNQLANDYGGGIADDVAFIRTDTLTFEEVVIRRSSENFSYYSLEGYGEGYAWMPTSFAVLCNGELYTLEVIRYSAQYVGFTVIKVNFDDESISIVYSYLLPSGVHITYPHFFGVFRDSYTTAEPFLVWSVGYYKTGIKYVERWLAKDIDEYENPLCWEGEKTTPYLDCIEKIVFFKMPLLDEGVVSAFDIWTNSEIHLDENVTYVTNAFLAPYPIYYKDYVYLIYNFEMDTHCSTRVSISECVSVLLPKPPDWPIPPENYPQAVAQISSTYSGSPYIVVTKVNVLESTYETIQIHNNHSWYQLQSGRQPIMEYVLVEGGLTWYDTSGLSEDNQVFGPSGVSPGVVKVVFDKFSETLYAIAYNLSDIGIYTPTKTIPDSDFKEWDDDVVISDQNLGILKINVNNINDYTYTKYVDQREIYDLVLSDDHAYRVDMTTDKMLLYRFDSELEMADCGEPFTEEDWPTDLWDKDSLLEVYEFPIVKLTQQASSDEKRFWKIFQKEVEEGEEDKYVVEGYSVLGSYKKSFEIPVVASGSASMNLLDVDWFNLYLHDTRLILTLGMGSFGEDGSTSNVWMIT